MLFCNGASFVNTTCSNLTGTRSIAIVSSVQDKEGALLTVFGENIIGSSNSELGDNTPKLGHLIITDLSLLFSCISITTTKNRCFKVASEFTGCTKKTRVGKVK